ncbi:hypothetical protein CO157_00500 [Candidatus Peregrinibacteria bacterium CG_4_9_14_3_um_filter_49_12]|nr:MAG: hypothetical protein CO157_00500 [Candidatus Peregrinibacteria bacterium CG_4_9_14_3_um_filter_49_12]
MDSEQHDPGRKEGQKSEKKRHDENLLELTPESIGFLEHSVMSRFHDALNNPDSGKDALREALNFHGIQPETVCAYASQRDPKLLTIMANAHAYSRKFYTAIEKPVRLTEEPVGEGRSIPGIVDEIEDNLSCYPRDGLAFLQHVRTPLPEHVYVLPSTQGSIRPLSVFKDSRFNYSATTRMLYDYREVEMSSCIERAHQVWEDLEQLIEQEGLLRLYLQTNKSDPWKINVYKFTADPLRRFKALLYSKGNPKPKNVTLGEEKDGDGWEEKFDEIYSYDAFRADFTPEAIENVERNVRELLQSNTHVHLGVQLESTEMEDVIVTFYAKSKAESDSD